MLRASTLYIVIVISLILSVFCSALIASAYYYRLALIDRNLEERLAANLYSAANLVLMTNRGGENEFIDLYGQGTDSIVSSASRWGLYKKFSVQSFSGRKRLCKSFLAGYPLKDKFASALYIADLNRPISVCGSTHLKGECYLPKAGVQRAYIAGKSFLGDKLVDGQILQSTPYLPELHGKEQLGELFLQQPAYKIMDFSDLDLDQPLINSYNDSAIFIQSAFPIRLSSDISGHVIVYSEAEIHISASARLKDIIVVAPYIAIADQFEGSIQVFASDSIRLGKGAHLQYPSAIVLRQRESPLGNSAVLLEQDSECSGLVMAVRQKETQYECTIKLKPGSRVHGQVYSDGYADIEGTIAGNLTTQKIIFKNPNSTYVNHFMDAKIDYSLLSPYFAGSAMGADSSGGGLRIIKWLE